VGWEIALELQKMSEGTFGRFITGERVPIIRAEQRGADMSNGVDPERFGRPAEV
jgi:hypothetical protein